MRLSPRGTARRRRPNVRITGFYPLLDLANCRLCDSPSPVTPGRANPDPCHRKVRREDVRDTGVVYAIRQLPSRDVNPWGYSVVFLNEG